MNSIELEQVSLEEASRDEDVMFVVVPESMSQEEVEDKVRERLVGKNWWLQDQWREKGLPTEQLTISVGDKKIELYNFGEALDPIHVEELQRVIEDYSHVDNGAIVGGRIEYILIDNVQLINTNTGKDMNGYSSAKERAIKLYPRALKQILHRVSGVSNFEGTVIHELAHRVSVDFQNQWKERFGWQDLDTPEKLPGGNMKYYHIADAERCITDYAAIDHTEDICESMVAALRNPDILDAERLEVLQKEVLSEREKVDPGVSIAKKQGNEIELPKISKARYKRVKAGRMKLLG